jgi:hypothetical protein
VRVLDASKPVSITLPGIVHRFPKGHSIEFVSAATDAAYKNSIPVQPVTVSTSRTAPSSITLPALSPTQARRALTPASPRRSNPATASSALPASGGGASAGSVGAMLVALGLAAFAIRRRRPATRGR